MTHIERPEMRSDLNSLADDDPRFGPPERVTGALVDPQLGLLPTHEMDWPDFEKLLLRIAREVEGLREVSLFGDPGQAQDGLDAVGLNSANEAEGIQGKRYTNFTTTDLNAAATKFLDGSLPFPIRRLSIGVSCRAHERKVVERVMELNQEHQPIEIRLWDRDRLSEMLRTRPEIVLEFFGPVTTSRFCGPYSVTPVEVPSPDAVSTADAVLRGPAKTSGASEELESAKRTEDDDPETALRHIQRAQELLTAAGFPAHAQVLETQSAKLLARLGRVHDSGRLLLDRVWAALDEDRSNEAAASSRELSSLVRNLASGDHDNRIMSETAAAISEMAVNLYQHPLGQLPALADILGDGSLAMDRARLLLLASETALADGYSQWLESAVEPALALAESVGTIDEALGIRLLLVAADTTGNWSHLIDRARRRSIPRDLAALVLARHARFLAGSGIYKEADTEWSEAVEQACLTGRNADAADWLYSRRVLALRYSPPFFEDVFHPLAAALEARPTLPLIAATTAPIRERALEDIQREKPREATLRLRRYLRDAVVSGSWQNEEDARVLLADVFGSVGERLRAAHHLVVAGQADRAKKLGEGVGDQYIDVSEHLTASTYWTRAAALNISRAQGDLLPDDVAERVVGVSLSILEDARRGELIDTPLFAPSVYLAAHEALAALAGRLTEPQARQLLDHLAPLATAKEGTYRHTDDAHARSCAGIGESHPALLEQALNQLLELLARAGHALERPALALLEQHFSLVEGRLEDLAAGGNRFASEILAYGRPEAADANRAEIAAQDLMAPLSSGPGHYSGGTNAVGASVLALSLPVDRRLELITNQLDRARSPYEPAMNRSEYLLAAANLAEGLTAADAETLLPVALTEVNDPAPSQADEMALQYSHPLGSMQMSFSSDSRPAAVFLAARLAGNAQQRLAVRNAALRLIGSGGNGDYWVARALQLLHLDLEHDVPFLAKQGWEFRSVAAIGWVSSPSLDPEIGEALATDSDPRVRRSLATALASVDHDERTETIRQQLLNDPRYSVRRLLQTEEGPTSSNAGKD